MKTGLVISKDTYTIEGAPDELYVDSNTPMLKVFKNVSGALVINADGSFSSVGDYTWVHANYGWNYNHTVYNDGNYTILITFDDVLNYAPQFESYMDKDSEDKRVRLNNMVAGVGLTGHCYAFTSGGSSSIRINCSVLVNSGTNKPYPGTYGYFVQIYYDRASRP